MLTLEKVRNNMPVGHRNHINQDIIDKLNSLSSDPEEAKYIRDNFITYAEVLSEGKYSVKDYLNAVIYVSYKIMGLSNYRAYQKTFPERYQRMKDEGKDAKGMSSHVCAYNKNQIVNMIYERSMIPVWVLNQDMFQEALNTQYMLMSDPSNSGKVRTDAANSILTHLKRPETNNAQLKIDIALNDGMENLHNKLKEIAKMQQNTIEGKVVTAKEIAER